MQKTIHILVSCCLKGHCGNVVINHKLTMQTVLPILTQIGLEVKVLESVSQLVKC